MSPLPVVDPQVVSHVLRPAVVHRAATNPTPGPADPAPSHPPRVAPRQLLLHHYGLVQLHPRGNQLLARRRERHRESDGREASRRRHEVGAEDGGVGLRRHLVAHRRKQSRYLARNDGIRIKIDALCTCCQKRRDPNYN